METVELRITIDKEAVEAIFTLLKALSERESREESTKEENKEKDISLIHVDNNNIMHPYVTTDNNNNNINNNSLSVDVDEKAINKVSNMVITMDNGKAMSNVDKAMTDVYKAIPSLEDIEEYVNKCGYKMSSQKFYDYYKSKDWKTKNGVSIAGKWKGFIDNWAKSEFIQTMKPTTAGNTGTVEERHAIHPFVPTQFTEDGKLA